MSSTMTRGNIPRLMQEGAANVFGLEYNSYDPIYSKIYDIKNSEKAYELAVMVEGFGLAAAKDEAGDITFDTRNQGFVPKYIHTAYAKGFVMSYEAIADNLYKQQLPAGAEATARAMRITKEFNGAYLLNNAFSTLSAMPGGDGVAMCSTAHINGPSGGTYSNRLAIDADFAEASLEDMLKLIARAADPRGLPIALKANTVVGHTDQMFEFQRVLKSTLQNDTANNAISAVNSMNSIKNGFVASPYMSVDTDAWFITTDLMTGLKMYQREKVSFAKDDSFTSMNTRFRAYERYSFGYDDPRGIYGTAGA